MTDPYRTRAQAAAEHLVSLAETVGLKEFIRFGTSIDAGGDRTKLPDDVLASGGGGLID